MKKNNFIDYAYKEALKAKKIDDVPIGCVIVNNNKIISKGYNKKENKNNALLHAEIIAINKACKKMKSWRLDNCEIYITLEPCMMCLGAIIESRIKKIYYGTEKNEQMYDINLKKYNIQIVNLNDQRCSKILTDFFTKKRNK